MEQVPAAMVCPAVRVTVQNANTLNEPPACSGTCCSDMTFEDEYGAQACTPGGSGGSGGGSGGSGGDGSGGGGGLGDGGGGGGEQGVHC